jgi:Uma2 family endonuclease
MHESSLLLEPEDLASLPDGDSYELIDGKPVEKPMGAKSDRIALRLGARLDRFCDTTGVGTVYGSNTGYKCFPSRPRLLRKPDVSFVAKDRLPDGEPPDGDFAIRPDLVVEVVSPNDLYEEIEERVNDYLSAGVPLIWVISAKWKTVVVRRKDDTAVVRRESHTLDGEDVVPGFSCPVAELFA